GAIHATNYLYINPIVAMITAHVVLNERITPLAIVGTLLILSGVYLAERGKQKSNKIASATSEQA
ncbi:MAG: EamA family transporter, partial [Alistipes sp.]|nr:EamA family transporter [Alistipes sp.]